MPSVTLEPFAGQHNCLINDMTDKNRGAFRHLLRLSIKPK